MDYPAALAAGWPISVLKLRALHANGDFDAYWTYHLAREHQRNHPQPRASYQLAT